MADVAGHFKDKDNKSFLIFLILILLLSGDCF